MVRPRSLQRILSDWPFAFAGGVVLWFVVAGMGATGLGFGNGDTPSIVTESAQSSDTETVTTDPAPSGVNAGAVEVRVKSFRLDEDRKTGSLQAEFTLEVKDLLKTNVDFSPSQLTLRRAGDSTRIAPKEDIKMGVSPKLPLIAPVTFSVSPRPGASYELMYAGRTLYTGPPF